MALWPHSQCPPGLLSRVLATAINLAQSQLNCHLTLLPANLQAEFLQIAQDIEQQQQKMDFWHEAHGLPSPNSLQSDHPNVPIYAPLSGHHDVLSLEPGNLGVTPPMPLPLVDSHLSMVDNPLGAASSSEGQDSFDSSQNWASTSSGSGPGSSPFRHAFNYAQRSMDTVSVQQLHPELSQCLVPPTTDDDMGVFSFSDSDGSLPGTSFGQPTHPPSFSYQTRSASQRHEGDAMASQDVNSYHQAHGRQQYGVSSRYQQQQGRHQQQQQQQQQQASRRPLPTGSRGSVSSQNGSAQPSNGGGAHHASKRPSRNNPQTVPKPEPLPILRSNGPLHRSTKIQPADSKARISRHADTPPPPPPSSHSRTRSTATVGGQVSIAPGTAPSSPHLHHSSSSSASSSSFPPGQDKPGFVPIGKPQVASRAQGNHWPIARDLQVRIIAAERGVGADSSSSRLTYKQISAKYSHWRSNESTLRGIKRVHELPREHRERRPTWGDEHIQSLRRALPRCIDSKGRVAWGQIVKHIKDDTGKPFGASTIRKKWEELARSGLVPDLSRGVGGHEEMAQGVPLAGGQDMAEQGGMHQGFPSPAASENPVHSDDGTGANCLQQSGDGFFGGDDIFSSAGGSCAWGTDMDGQW